MRVIQLLAFTSTVCLTQGFSIGTSSSTSSTQLNAVAQTRSQFFNTLSVAAATAATTTLAPFVANAEEVVTLPSGTTYEVLKAGEGPSPTVGELAAIRFKAEVKQSGQKIDDIFDSPEPYYTRVGSGGLLKVRSKR
jgi:FKBP-type peptidyl-prolyl cis-trans isomerase